MVERVESLRRCDEERRSRCKAASSSMLPDEELLYCCCSSDARGECSARFETATDIVLCPYSIEAGKDV